MIYDAETNELLIEFDTYIDNSFHQTNGVAFEPTERDTFSSDSRQITPYNINITAIASILPKNSTDVRDTVDKIEDKLRELLNSSRLVTVVLEPMTNFKNAQANSSYFQYAHTYENVILTGLDYQNNPEQLELRAAMTFQEFRITDTEYTNQNTVRNPEDSSTQNAGQVQPQTPNTSILKDLFNFLKGLFGGGS